LPGIFPPVTAGGGPSSIVGGSGGGAIGGGAIGAIGGFGAGAGAGGGVAAPAKVVSLAGAAPVPGPSMYGKVREQLAKSSDASVSGDVQSLLWGGEEAAPAGNAAGGNAAAGNERKVFVLRLRLTFLLLQMTRRLRSAQTARRTKSRT
jgi:hypothetical protein